MYNSDTEIMFPLRVIPQILDLRGESWKYLMEHLTSESARVEEKAAFTLLMVKLGGCQTCSVDSYRGMRGCTICVKQTVRRNRSSDEELVRLFRQSLHEVEKFLEGKRS